MAVFPVMRAKKIVGILMRCAGRLARSSL